MEFSTEVLSGSLWVGELGEVGGLSAAPELLGTRLFEDKSRSVWMPVPRLSWLKLSDLRLHKDSGLFTLTSKAVYRQTPCLFLLSIGSRAILQILEETSLKRNLQGHSIPTPKQAAEYLHTKMEPRHRP